MRKERPISGSRSKRFPILETSIVDGQGKGKLRPDHSSVIPNASWYPTMDTYGHYRAMVFAASLPDEPKIAQSSPVADHPFSAGYSEWDQKIIDRAAQLCGFTPAKLADRYSKEPDDIHKISPNNHNSGRNMSEKSK